MICEVCFNEAARWECSNCGEPVGSNCRNWGNVCSRCRMGIIHMTPIMWHPTEDETRIDM